MNHFQVRTRTERLNETRPSVMQQQNEQLSPVQSANLSIIPLTVQYTLCLKNAPTLIGSPRTTLGQEAGGLILQLKRGPLE